MHKAVRYPLYTLLAVVLLLACVLSYAAYLLNGDGVRVRLQSSLSRALGRTVRVKHLHLSPWTGDAVADDFQIDDDATFSSVPFVQARQVYLGLDIRHLLLHRTITIRSIALQQPSVRLLRNGAGTWNYASLVSAHAARGERPDHEASEVTISSFAVDAGSVLVQTAAADGSAVRRTFHLSTVQVHDVGPGQVSRFQLAAQLPGGGTVVTNGTAGPWGGNKTAQLHVQTHVQATHLGLLAAGLVPAGSPVTGDLQQANAQLTWSGEGLLVSTLDVNSSHLALNFGAQGSPKANVRRATATVWRDLLRHLTVQQANIHADAVEIHAADGRTVQFRNVQAALGQWLPGGRATFRVGADLAGGVVRATGGFRVPAPEGQPFDLTADLTMAHLRLARSGLLGPGTAVDAQTDGVVRVRLQQNSLQAAGTFRLTDARLVRGGTPLPGPLLGGFRLHQTAGEGELAGTLEALTLQLNGATLRASGSYARTSGAPTVRLAVTGDQMPVYALEAALPSVGVALPEDSRLQGGTLSLALDVQGALPHPAVSGPVDLQHTRLAGYDLGSKLRGLASFTGGRIGSATVNGTQLRRLSFTLHTGAGPVRTDHLQAEIEGIGTASGSGSIGPGGTLDYRLTLKLNELIPGAGGAQGLANELVGALPAAWARRLQGAVRYLSEGPMKNGVPILVRGTAHKPTVTPDLGALLPAERRR